MTRHRVGALAILLVLVSATAAPGFDGDTTFKQGSLVISPEAGYGQQFEFQHMHDFTGLEFADVGVRVGWLPFGPAGPGPLHGALEIGLEPLYQRYVDPVDAFFAGVGAVFRYHFLSLGRFVPYVEIAGFVGGSDLRVAEIRSDFAFLLFGGAGAAFFVSGHTAVYGGYRLQHVSNGNTQDPNRGFESHTGVVGVSFFFQ